MNINICKQCKHHVIRGDKICCLFTFDKVSDLIARTCKSGEYMEEMNKYLQSVCPYNLEHLVLSND